MSEGSVRGGRSWPSLVQIPVWMELAVLAEARITDPTVFP
jgi:hypothetical protein